MNKLAKQQFAFSDKKHLLWYKKTCAICGRHINGDPDIFFEEIKHGYKGSALECDSCTYTRQKVFHSFNANPEIAMIMDAAVLVKNDWGSKVK